MRKRYGFRLTVGFALVAALSLPLSSTATADGDDSSSTFVASRDASELRASSVDLARAIPNQGEDVTYSVTFEVDRSDIITDKQIALVRNDSDLDDRTLATFNADSSGNVELEWWDPTAGAIEWTVERDGEILTKVMGDSFTDTHRDISHSTEYKVYGKRIVDVDGEPAEEPFMTILEVPAIDTSPIGMEHDDPAAVSASENTDVFPRIKSSAALRGANTTIQQQLNTFIPTEKADTPFDIQPCLEAYDLGGAGYFGGDNRSFASPGQDRPSSRTGLELTRIYGANNEHVGGSNKTWTSGTTLYGSDGILRVYAEADVESGITQGGGMGGPSGGEALWEHSVADPLCSLAPAIDYRILIKAYNDGTADLWGSHDQAPSYEYRTRVNGAGYANHYEFESKGLQYLLPPFPQAHVDLHVNVFQ